MAKEDEGKFKDAFTLFDKNGDGTLEFDEFLALLRLGDENFAEDEARTLFGICDKDKNGHIDFQEFVEYLCSESPTTQQKEFKELVNAQIAEEEDEDPEAAAEEEAKTIVLSKSLALRTDASKALKESGGDWRKLTWRERLEAILALEESLEEEEVVKPGHSHLAHMRTQPDLTHTKLNDRSGPLSQEVEMKHAASISPADVKKPKTKPLAEKSQEELVDYSIHKYDLTFAGRDPDAVETLVNFKEHLKTAGDPMELVHVTKYIAKGTAGWVFLAEYKSSGSVVAMKLIRMTQAISGIKEWYVSKLLRDAGVKNVVYTAEKVCVLSRELAPPIIEEELRNAGPVPFYVCLLQDFMNGGTLEGLVEKGKMTPRMMFKALEDVASTLAVMHSKSVYHKDVKPENVLVDMHHDSVVAAKLCDFGSAEISGNAKDNSADDIRRFGVTLFSLATGEGWTKNRLIREKHENLIKRLAEAVKTKEPKEIMSDLPEALEQILSGKLTMAQVAEMMAVFTEALNEIK
jgi:hypothetical protein